MTGVRVGLSRWGGSHGVARVGIGRSSAVSGMAAHVMTGVRVGLGRWGRSHRVARVGIGRSSAVSGMAAHVMTGVRVGLGRWGRSHGVARVGIGRSSAVSGMAAHVMTRMGIGLSAGGGCAVHGAGLAVTHHRAVMRGLGRRSRRLSSGSMAGMFGMALGQGGPTRGHHQRGERERKRKGLHETAPSSGRTVTTLNMPACMCIRR